MEKVERDLNKKLLGFEKYGDKDFKMQLSRKALLCLDIFLSLR